MKNFVPKSKFSFLIIGVFIFQAMSVRAASPLDVAINEIAWMGTQNSVNDEWIELYNNTQTPVNLDGWTLVADDGTPEIKLSGLIYPNSFYLLERTDDSTVSQIQADKIYTGALNNSGEELKLYDVFNNLIDVINCASGWFGGDNGTKKTLERINPLTSADNPLNWRSSQEPGGTPKYQNSLVSAQLPPPTPLPTILPTPLPSLVPTPSPQQQEIIISTVEKDPVYCSGVVLNEILPSPEGPDDTEEWIEISNQNNFEVNPDGWRLEDKTGKTAVFTFTRGIKIPAQGFLLLRRVDTKITLNNDEDGLGLICPDGTVADFVSYKDSRRGQSYNRFGDEWFWSESLTPMAVNIPSAEKLEEKVENYSSKNNTGQDENTQITKNELAAASKYFPKNSNPWVAFLLASGVAALSGLIIIFIKRRLGRNIAKQIEPK